MALRRQDKRISTINSLRRQRQPPRAVAVAFRQRYEEHHNRGGDIIESPGPPAAQDPAGDLSAPIPQRNSEPAVSSVIDVVSSQAPGAQVVRSEGGKASFGIG